MEGHPTLLLCYVMQYCRSPIVNVLLDYISGDVYASSQFAKSPLLKGTCVSTVFKDACPHFGYATVKKL